MDSPFPNKYSMHIAVQCANWETSPSDRISKEMGKACTLMRQRGEIIMVMVSGGSKSVPVSTFQGFWSTSYQLSNGGPQSTALFSSPPNSKERKAQLDHDIQD